MKANHSLSKQAMTLIIARGISFLLTLGIPLILARYLTISEFGAYKQSILLCSTLINLLPWGMSQSLYYFIPKEPENRAGYLANSFLFLLVVGVLSLVGFYFSGTLLERSFQSSALGGVGPLLGLYTFFMVSSLYAEVALVSDNRTNAAAGVILLNEVFKAAALIGGALLVGSFMGIMVGLVIAGAVRFTLMTIYFRKDIGTILSGPNFDLFRKQWSYSLPFGMTILFIFIQDYFHQYYISYIYGSDGFAIYAIGCLQLPLVDLFYSSIGDVSMVKMQEQLRSDDEKGARMVWHESLLKLAVIFLPLTIYLAVVSTQFIVALFTIRYIESVPIFLVTILAMPLTLLLTDPVIRVLGETRFLLRISILRLPITIALVVFGVKFFGMIGASGGALLAILLVRMVMMARIGSRMKTGFINLLPWRSLFRILVAALGAALPIAGVLAVFSLNPKVALVVTSPIYGVTFLLLGLWLNIFPAEEKQMARNLFRKIGKKFGLKDQKPKVWSAESEVSG
jgi:O-antigen/teichoic acid export membrane protein